MTNNQVNNLIDLLDQLWNEMKEQEKAREFLSPAVSTVIAWALKATKAEPWEPEAGM